MVPDAIHIDLYDRLDKIPFDKLESFSREDLKGKRKENSMEYRKLPHGDEQISIIGLGNSSLGASGEEEAERTVAMALENGINYFDMAAGDATPFPAYGRVVSGCRDKIYFKIHFGADYCNGKYSWTLDLDKIKRSIDWQLKALQTDYIDFGFIHCIDEISDLETCYCTQNHCLYREFETPRRNPTHWSFLPHPRSCGKGSGYAHFGYADVQH